MIRPQSFVKILFQKAFVMPHCHLRFNLSGRFKRNAYDNQQRRTSERYRAQRPALIYQHRYRIDYERKHRYDS
jgi:hypothetical protein